MRALPVPDPGTPDLRSPWRFIFWLMTKQRASVLLSIMWGCAWMIAQALVPAVIGAAVDALSTRNAAAFSVDCALVLGLGIATAVAGILRHRCVVTNFLDAAYRIIQLVTGQAARLGHTLTRRLTTGEVISVGNADVEAIGDAIQMTGRGSGAVAAFGVVAVILLSRSAALGVIVLIGAPTMTALMGVLLRPLHHRQAKYRDLLGRLAARAADIVSGLRVLRGIGGEARFSQRYRDESQRLRWTGVHVARTESMLSGAEILLPGMFVTVATWLAAHYALRRSITPGELVTFYAYATFLGMPLATLTEMADHMVRGLVSARRVIKVLALNPDVTDPEVPAAAPPVGSTLHDPLSGLTVRAGEFVGVASDTPGAGVALADRLGNYWTDGANPADVAVKLGSVPLTDLPVDVVRSSILVSTGDAHLFAGRVDEQLVAARVPSGSDREHVEAVNAAIDTASAHDVIEAVPGGLSGHVAARGRNLSGGQAQRLRLSRALLADPEVLVLVEPTSAVDAHTEASIGRGLRAARSGRTTVVVTDSPLLLDMTDRVAFVRDGTVVAEGRHRELLSTNPDYAAVVARGES